jgi:hypothetical protein
MRQMISGLIAAIALVTASAVPAMACGDSPCGQVYAPAPVYVPAPVYSGCYSCGGWAHERLPDPVQQYHQASYPLHQYYYVDQGPAYSGPGNFAPYRVYREGSYWGGYRHHHHYGYGYHHYGYGYHTYPRYHHWHAYHHTYGYPEPHSLRYGYVPHHTLRYGGTPHHEGYGYREHTHRYN